MIYILHLEQVAFLHMVVFLLADIDSLGLKV